jgi:hypothetical protein
MKTQLLRQFTVGVLVLVPAVGRNGGAPLKGFLNQ